MGEMISYPIDGGECRGYLSLPPTGTGPAVVVIHERWGLAPHIMSLADRFAAAGFVALAPDLYRGEYAVEPDEAERLIAGLAMDRTAKDIIGAADYLVATQRATDGPDASGKVGVVGFCMGGSMALWSTTLSPRIVAAIGFYPALSWERMAPRWSEYAGRSAVIHRAEDDNTPGAADIPKAMTAIETAGGRCLVYDYPGTRHAFFNDDRPDVYHGRASTTAWARTLEHLRGRLA